jgi:hypothetical protein
MQKYFITPGFLTYTGVMIVACLILAIWVAPRYGKKSMMVYLSICSLIGGPNVVSLQGVGTAVVTQISGKPQFNGWFIYVLIVFLIGTLVTEIIYLNVSLGCLIDAGSVSLSRFLESTYNPATPLTDIILTDNLSESIEHISGQCRHSDLLRILHHICHCCLNSPFPRS